MPELRKEPIVGIWVIISTERGKRPSDFERVVPKKKAVFCPFCPGNEDKTPPSILVYRNNMIPYNNANWTLRVVPNKFPALRIEGELIREGEGVYDKMTGIGAHEVIIESPDHEATFSNMHPKALEDVFWSYRDRIMDLKKDRRLKYCLIFKNHGEAAGASLEHTHSQLIALPIVPIAVSEELAGSESYYKYKERCIYCDIIRQELNERVRVISENKHFLAIAPYASRSPFETWILPKRHIALYENTEVAEMESLASIFSDIFVRMDAVLENPPYNFMLHTSPFYENTEPYYHWHFEIVPKLTKLAGFEWGSGFFINPTPPEDAAQYMREAKI